MGLLALREAAVQAISASVPIWQIAEPSYVFVGDLHGVDRVAFSD
jgi:hypothetical protein